jgi:hypothetical protein
LDRELQIYKRLVRMTNHIAMDFLNVLEKLGLVNNFRSKYILYKMIVQWHRNKQETVRDPDRK